jgi:hypothetical protein
MKKSNVPFEIGASVATIAIQLAKLSGDNDPSLHIEEAIELIDEARETIAHPHTQEIKQDDTQ